VDERPVEEGINRVGIRSIKPKEDEMLRVAFRLWLVSTALYLMVLGYQYRQVLGGLMQRDWVLAIQYGVNNAVCDAGIQRYCRDLHVGFWQEKQLNETFGLFVVLFVVPVLFFPVLRMVLWAFEKPAKGVA
jgi:hypothetical protein